MNLHAASPARPAPWAVPLAFTLVYLAWGTTYIAIRLGVHQFPPALFGGVRIGLAGLVLLAFLGCRGEALRLSRGDLIWSAVLGAIFFMAGNYLVTLGSRYVASGVAAILVATTPLWTGLMETLWPGGERLRGRGWAGLLVGLAGVALLKLDHPFDRETDLGALLVVGSALSWAFGSCLLRRHRQHGSHLLTAAYQMIFGGIGQTVVGLLLNEPAQITSASFTPTAVYAFFHLLIFGSLVGFVAYNWLLGHVTTSQASTYAYVNPAVAILVGWLLGDQEITLSILGGLAVILLGVALVRTQKQGTVTVVEEPQPEIVAPVRERWNPP
ncbi:MAG: EamA family transporter, partial [Planctomycetia bacterium]|nr:EamA family transporter [Planctomycetia bacterium]